ncbi:MAG: hypothetical protein HYZ47_01955, partial [Simkania negevensis]|nr:hypothetical protein [Simkania negevensis]
MKKREVFFLLMIFPVALFYVFFNYFTEERFSKKPLVTMEDSFDRLLGLEGGGDAFIKTEKDRDDLRFYQKLYEKNKGYQFLSSPVLKIPAEVHLIWLGPRSFPKESVKHIRSWMSYHPDWTFHFWTDRERPPPCNGMQVHYVKDFPFQFLKKYYELSNNWGEKSDILRYEILYQEGGVYIDHDASCIRSFYPLHA